MQKRISILFSDPFDPHTHPHNMTIPVLLAEFNLNRFMCLNDLACCIPDHVLVFPKDSFRRICIHQLSIFLHCKSGHFRYPVREIYGFKLIRSLINGNTAGDCIDDILHLSLDERILLYHAYSPFLSCTLKSSAFWNSSLITSYIS